MTNLDAIFKAYDIRGVYPEEINEEVAYKIGRATARFLKAKELIVGRDNRLSSENLFKVLCEGIRDEGIDVIDIGLATTPMFYFAAVKWGIRGGIMITASHNPAKYNGFKIVREQAMPIGEKSGLEKIKKLTEKTKDQPKAIRGELKTKEILKDYIEHILSFIHIKDIKPFKIIIDSTNGTAGIVIPELFKHTSVNLIHIFAELDGSFPNHAPDPSLSNPENTKALRERVLSERADVGVAFDGDGDRILFFDQNGNGIGPDLITALLIHHLFPKTGKILYTVIASQVIREEIENSGNIPICSKVGHTFVKEKMSREKIIFGAESSGHYYLKDNYFIESPFIVLLKVLEILSKTKMPLSELVKPFQKYYLERINLKVKNPEEALKKIRISLGRQRRPGSQPKGLRDKKTAKISYFDGLSIELSDWWFNLRPSHTEPFIRLTIEARTKELLEEKKKELTKLLKS